MNVHVIKENIKAKILEDVDEYLNELANVEIRRDLMNKEELKEKADGVKHYELFPWEAAFQMTKERHPSYIFFYGEENEILGISQKMWDEARKYIISDIWDEGEFITRVNFKEGGCYSVPSYCVKIVDYKVKGDNLNLKDFIEHYVAHNTVVTLWEETLVQGGKDEPYYHKYEKLWKGMDWQIVYGPDDENYFKAHPDVEKCPFADRKVIKVLGGFEDEINTVDSINLCVEGE